jgi:hypothetical protein
MAVYPAFSSGGPGRPQHPPVNVNQALKRIPTNGGNLKGMSPKRVLPRLSSEPGRENNMLMFDINSEDDRHFDVFPAETLTHEIFGELDARIYYTEALRNLMRFTRQVWIGSAAPYIDAATSCHFELTDERKAHGLGFSLQIHVGFKSIRLCTEDIWRRSLAFGNGTFKRTWCRRGASCTSRAFD